MPYETDFDTAFTILLGKARGTGTVTPAPLPGPGPSPSVPAQASSYTVNFPFGGGGLPITAGLSDPMLIEVPDSGEIVWAHMYAGDANGQPADATATVEVHATRYETFGGSTPVYGSGSAPSMTASPKSDTSLSGWFTHLDNGATLIARLTSFSGVATWLTLVLKVRRDYTVVNQLTVLESGTGNSVLDGSGNPVVYST